MLKATLVMVLSVETAAAISTLRAEIVVMPSTIGPPVSHPGITTSPTSPVTTKITSETEQTKGSSVVTASNRHTGKYVDLAAS